MNAAQIARQSKQKSPSRYCANEKCLWRLSSGPCPRHKASFPAPLPGEVPQAGECVICGDVIRSAAKGLPDTCIRCAMEISGEMDAIRRHSVREIRAVDVEIMGIPLRSPRRWFRVWQGVSQSVVLMGGMLSEGEVLCSDHFEHDCECKRLVRESGLMEKPLVAVEA